MASMAKPSTKWGSFFEKAVAGVESRLDNILGEDDVISKTDNQTTTPQPPSDKYEPAYSMEPGRSLG